MQVLGHYKVVLDGTWWYWLSRGRYWLIFGGTVSKWGGTGWYLVVLGHYNLALELSGTGLVKGYYACIY